MTTRIASSASTDTREPKGIAMVEPLLPVYDTSGRMMGLITREDIAASSDGRCDLCVSARPASLHVSDLMCWRGPDLRQTSRENGLRVSGTKRDLAARLHRAGVLPTAVVISGGWFRWQPAKNQPDTSLV